MVGPAGSGKTEAAKALPTATDRPFFYFNLGATQDPRSTLIGNTHFKNNETLFDESAFIKAIKTDNAVILLDELSRAHPEAWNILMTVLEEASEVGILPFFDAAGGGDSERLFVKQVIQKHLGTANEDIFNLQDEEAVEN